MAGRDSVAHLSAGSGRMKKQSSKTGIVIVTKTQDTLDGPETLALLSDIRSLIEAARMRVSTTANVEMVLLYWHIGDRILKDILGMERADYGKQIVQTLAGQLGWSHFVQIIVLDDPLKRDFYAEMCRIERWSTRTLKAKISGMLYERT